MAGLTTTSSAVFIPEIWGNETIQARRVETVQAALFREYPHNKKAGDIVHLPLISAITARQKVAGVDIIPTVITETDVQINLNQNYYTAIAVEDIATVQSQYNLLKEYAGQMSKGLNIKIEDTIATEWGGNASGSYNADGATADSSGAAVTLNGILTALQYLDENNVPQKDRFMLYAPADGKTLRLIDGVISGDYVDGKPTVTGEFGRFWGIKVVMSNNLYTDSNSKRNMLVAHKDGLYVAMQQKPKNESWREAKEQMDYVSITAIWGVKTTRGDHLCRLVTNHT